ncbi:FecR family protein [Lunatimonas salinarum]|uniref:FecR family protein n=1 Tax=Lunatimonas salinarum TaxID=1774590 RepID=UPI001FD7BEC8|nr:FecR family protein [Lunatimonas salinarum]
MKHIEDFLTDPEFIRWVKNPDKELEAYWEQWRKANPEQLAPMKMAKEILLRSNVDRVKPPQGLKEEVMAEVLRIKAKSVGYANTNHSKRSKGIKDSFWNKLGQMTRVAAILVTCLILAWMLGPTPESKAPSMVAAEAAILVKKTAAGEKLQLTLADGTKIWMNSSSEVVFPEKFESDRRNITVKGEVYLEVAHDSLRPFTVFTDGLTTTVLGTSFNVNAKNPANTQIALITGKVAVSDTQKEVIMNAGQMLDFQGTLDSTRIRGFKPSEVLAWKEGVLLFQKASLQEVIQALEEWYGVEISAENAGGVTWQFSGEYRQQVLVDVLESMSFIQGFEYQLNENGTVTIKF